MFKFNIAICDDDAAFCEKITTLITDLIKIHEYTLNSFRSGAELLRFIEKNVVNLVFLDIDMPDADGYEVAERLNEINKGIQIAFVTNHDEMLFHTCRYQPIGLIRKSHLEELPGVINFAIERFDKLNLSEMMIYFEIGGRNITDVCGNILYFETSGHYVVKHDQTGEISKYRCTMNELFRHIKDCGFVRTHISYAVNLCHISHIRNGTIILDNGIELPLSRTKFPEIASSFHEYKRMTR